MNGKLNGKRILIISTNYGVERDEILEPLEALRAQAATVVHAAAHNQPVQTLLRDTATDIVLSPDTDLSSVSADDFDALVIPGGTINADNLRVDANAIALARAFAQSGKPIAAVCHAPWLLVDAGLVPGKRLTSYHTLRADLQNAGGVWVNEAVVKSSTGSWTLITSRDPDDLPVFSRTITDELVG
ncbi:DJ-1/PfpI/YhbO family deglycase/protease [Paraburkholderia caballeronis]|uniref:Protease I n=1 Tax=Paraburkholderia caballeronis TaxID=416943 RepID=A0A1H7L783_9BURK|nr:DJ-1/PfpI/YhbO family deglycase/protease [Paraburkholderia caballeronis]PXW28327.1 protease I [Paraburkholderia caballeronis]PXX03693.1 protease I [Paraburkholderia caballeronis]RAK04437.1 protease I [Paraburkholderia caballeronis]SED80201.1 protease I [Paraburkholderia caballeronis]SEK94903.1 protease I [Paraburkholderia caballeronis]